MRIEISNLLLEGLKLLMFSLTFAFFNLAGFLESFYYDRLPRETIGGMKAQKNIKLQMVLSRVVFFIVLLLPALLLHRTSMYVCYVSCLCIYPYIHLGSYYSNRNKLNPNIYTDGWNSQESDTSTAFIDKAQDKLEKKYKIFNTIIIRQTLFLFGVILFILSVI